MFAKRFSDLNPYIPGEQPKDRVYIKLNANENPYPPSPEVGKVLKEFNPDQLRLYPDPDSNELRNAIARMLGNGIAPEMIFAGNGSDEVLSFVFYTFFDDDAPLYFPEHTYSFYPVYSDYYGIPYKKIPLKKDFSIDTEALLEGKSSGIIFANPNAPTGIFLSLSEIRDIMDKYSPDRVVVVDEAYIDFGGESAIPLLKDYKNLVIIRTFSKSFCFAGARLGFMIANPELIDAVFTTKNSFNHFPVDALTQKIGIASCTDSKYYREICIKISETRDNFSAQLRNAGWEVLPSMANFVFVRKDGFDGEKVYNAVKSMGILIRYFNKPGISDYVRITIGKPEDMKALFEIMQGININ
jgi:histidinol-phosphate aminotransferase